MPESSKRSSPIELEYHSLRVMNDCEILRNNDICVPTERENPLAGRAHSDAGIEGGDSGDGLTGTFESGSGQAFGRSTMRRIAMACALAALAGVGIGLIAILTTVGSRPVKAVIGVVPVQPTEHATINAATVSADASPSVRTPSALAENSFDGRFQVARSGINSNEALQSRTERRPLGKAAARGSDKTGPGLGIVEYARPVKTVAIEPALQPVVGPVLGYVPADAASASGGRGASAAQLAIAEATKRQGEGPAPEIVGPSYQVIASAAPAGRVDVPATGQAAASVASAPAAAPVAPEPAAVESAAAVPATQEPAAAEPAIEQVKTGTVTVSVNMREKAANDARIVAVIPPKTRVGLGSCDRWWCEVTYSGSTGFIGKKFIESGS